MIKITSQDSLHQCDIDGNKITTWDEYRCCWIVNKEYENDTIDWFGKDGDFPAGSTLAQFEEQNPKYAENPCIETEFYWASKEEAILQFGYPDTFGAPENYWDKIKYPYSCFRSWNHMDTKKENVVETFGKYCDFNKHATRVVIKYNNELLFDGVLK